MWKYFILLMTVPLVHSLTDEQWKETFTMYLIQCMKDHPVVVSELKALKQLVVPKKTETKCLLACAYKLEGSLNEKGMYDVEHVYKVAESSKNGDEKRFENAKKLADICAAVNKIEVSDGGKGCDRASQIFKCTIENAPKLGFKV